MHYFVTADTEHAFFSCWIVYTDWISILLKSYLYTSHRIIHIISQFKTEYEYTNTQPIAEHHLKIWNSFS